MSEFVGELVEDLLVGEALVLVVAVVVGEDVDVVLVEGLGSWT